MEGRAPCRQGLGIISYVIRSSFAHSVAQCTVIIVDNPPYMIDHTKQAGWRKRRSNTHENLGKVWQEGLRVALGVGAGAPGGNDGQ